MSLADLRDGARVFIDANIFIYHFGGRSLECKAFLERCARRELIGCTSTPILAEVLHRCMVAEAIAKGLVTARTAVRKLGETPEVVQQLTQYQDDVSKISYMQLTIFPLTLAIVQASAEVRKSEGLLTNDSFVVAMMREQGIVQLATAKGDFDRVSGRIRNSADHQWYSKPILSRRRPWPHSDSWKSLPAWPWPARDDVRTRGRHSKEIALLMR